MAKIIIAGDAVVVTSALKLEDIKTVQKYRPEALTLMGGEDNKEPVFSICATTGTGSVNAIGASFGRASHDEDGLATVTMGIPSTVSNVKEWAADTFGVAVTQLAVLEEKIPAVLEEIKTQKQAIMDGIEVL